MAGTVGSGGTRFAFAGRTETTLTPRASEVRAGLKSVTPVVWEVLFVGVSSIRLRCGLDARPGQKDKREMR